MIGKFEGTPSFVKYYWNRFLEGLGDGDAFPSGDEHAAYYTLFEVTPNDVERFPGLLHVGHCIAIYEETQGFIGYYEFADIDTAYKQIQGRAIC
jgi:hypothetical protein